MPETVRLIVNDVEVTMPAKHGVGGDYGDGRERVSTIRDGEPRGPLCGMGICFECRVTIDGEAHCRSCQTECRNGMDVRTDE